MVVRHGHGKGMSVMPALATVYATLVWCSEENDNTQTTRACCVELCVAITRKVADALTTGGLLPHHRLRVSLVFSVGTIELHATLFTFRWFFVLMTSSSSLAAVRTYLERFAFLNREDSKKLQDLLNVVKYAEKTEVSKVPRGAQVSSVIH